MCKFTESSGSSLPRLIMKIIKLIHYFFYGSSVAKNGNFYSGWVTPLFRCSMNGHPRCFYVGEAVTVMKIQLT